jgi:hypothetical protein
LLCLASQGLTLQEAAANRLAASAAGLHSGAPLFTSNSYEFAGLAGLCLERRKLLEAFASSMDIINWTGLDWTGVLWLQAHRL